MKIDFGYTFSISIKPVWKGTEIESIEDGLKEYEEITWKIGEKIIYIGEISK